MIFDKNETIKKIKENYALFGDNTDIISASIYEFKITKSNNGNKPTLDEKSDRVYSYNRSGELVDITDKNDYYKKSRYLHVYHESSYCGNDKYNFHHIYSDRYYHGNGTVKKGGRLAGSITPYLNDTIDFRIEIEQEFSENIKNGKAYTEFDIYEIETIDLKPINSDNLYLIYIESATCGPDHIRLVQGDDSYLTDPDKIFDIYEKGLYNSIYTEKLSVNRREELVIEKYNVSNTKQMTAIDKYKEISTNLPDEEVITPEEGMFWYKNYSSGIFSSVSDKPESDDLTRHLHMVSVNDYVIYGENKLYNSDSTVVYSKGEFGITIENDKITEQYLNDKCKLIEKSEDTHDEVYDSNFLSILNYLDGDVDFDIGSIIDTAEDEESNFQISIYDDKEEKIRTIIIKGGYYDEKTKTYSINALFRLYDKSLGYVYINDGSKYRLVALDFDNGEVAIDSTTRTYNDGDICTFDTYFESAHLKFGRATDISIKDGKPKKIIYNGPELELDIDYDTDGKVKINKMKSNLYSRYDDFVYIRDEYGALVKLDIVK